MDDFMDSLRLAEAYVQSSMSNDANVEAGECNFGNSKINVLPFKNIIVITKDETTAERYITTHPELAEDGNKVVARDWTSIHLDGGICAPMKLIQPGSCL